MPNLRPDLAAAGLRDVHQAQRLGPYLNSLWVRRSYIWFVSKSELRNRQMTSVLGNLWHLLNPLLQVAVFYLIFGVVLTGVRLGADNYVLFLTVGVLIFSDTQRSVIAGGNSIVNNRGVIQAIRFPRALLPVTATVTEMLASVPNVIVIYGMAVLTGETPHIRWLCVALVVGAQFWFNLGMACVAARATTHFRDTAQILPFVFRILMYISGIIFSVETFTADKSYGWLFDINPIYAYVSLARWCMLGGPLLAVWLIVAAVWTVGILVFGFLWFRAAEDRYARL